MWKACRTWVKRKFKAVKWWERQKAPNSTRRISRVAASSFSIALNSQPKTLIPTISYWFQWRGTLTYQQRRHRERLNLKAKATLGRKWEQCKVPTKRRTNIVIHYFSSSTRIYQAHTWISCKWSKSWAHLRTRSGIKSGWSSWGWAMRQDWRKEVSWMKISA